MTCQQCQQAINDDAAFCPHCGAKQQAQGNETPNQNSYSYGTGQSGQYGYQNQEMGNQQQYNTGRKNANFIYYGLAYIPILFWMPLAFDTEKSQTGRKCANQGLLLLILGAGVNIVNWIIRKILISVLYSSWSFSLFGILSTIISLIVTAIGIFELVCVIMGIIKGVKGEFFEVPLIGKITLLK